MIGVMFGMLATVAGTWLGAPTLTPILVGAGMGLVVRTTPARRAALAGALAWGILLLAAIARGGDVSALSRTLGGAMGLPPWALPLATLAYPAVLAASAAWLASLVTGPRGAPSGVDARPARETFPS